MNGASGPLALRSRQGNAAQTLPKEHFIYCIILPGFECHSSPIRQPTNSDPDPYMVTIVHGMLPQYLMVKVGISARSNPADRLKEIMKGFEGFGANNTHFQNLEEGDTIVEKYKQEASIIFLKRCYDVEEKVKDAEMKIRRLLGRDLGHSFQNQFTRHLDPSKRQYVDDVGMTEWILTDTSCMKWIQEAFRKNGIARSPSYFYTNTAKLNISQQNPTGDDVYRQILAVQSQRLHVCVPQFVHNVEIKFTPTGFSFPLTING